MRFIQCDDFVEPALADQIEQVMLSKQFPWHFYPNVNNQIPRADRGNYPPSVIYDDDRFDDSFGFAHLIFPSDIKPHSPWLEYPGRVLEAFVKRHGVTVQEVIRVKANLLVRTPGPVRPFAPHVDVPFAHWVVIYYVNDSDGDTIIFDKTYPDRAGATVTHTVSPKKGRAILFDGRHYHAGTCPVRHDTRVVFNYNFV